jgi:hypothetical protein
VIVDRCAACVGQPVPCDECVRRALAASAASAPVGRPPRSIDPAILWAHARETRRLQAQARIERIVTFAQIGVGLMILAPFGMLVVHWGDWTTLQTLAQVRDVPWTFVGVATGLIALGAFGLSALISQDA